MEAGDASAFERVRRVRQLGPELFSASGEEHPPALLSGMAEAVELVRWALSGSRLIAVYGDYDADGVCACALLVKALRAGGQDPIAYIPSREVEGYGLNLEALRELSQRGAELVITVDCGTTALEVARERPEGLRLLITDHHLPQYAQGSGEVELAPADALVNPQRPDDGYPFKGLSGTGVAYKLALALEQAGLLPGGTAERQLPLVALGTVADMMPLQDENRLLVRRGLSGWEADAGSGLKHLAHRSGQQGSPSSSDLAFGLGPRINAAGRMGDAELALRCCLSPDAAQGRAAAEALEELNRERRRLLAAAMDLLVPRVEELPDEQATIVVGSPEVALGVVGLVAGRLADQYGRPAFIFSQSGEEWRGSARGVGGMNLVEILQGCSAHLARFGGHQGAGGFSLLPGESAARAFAAAAELAVRAQLGGASPSRSFQVDALVRLGECRVELAEELLALQPCGTGNPPVLFCAGGCTVVRTEPLGASPAHLKVVLSDGSGRAEAISFNRPWLRRHLPDGRRVDALFELELDRWRGRRQARLLLRDLRPARA